MAIVNRKTNETSHIGAVLHVRGTFRMDMSMDEVFIWHPKTKTVSIEYICGDTWAEVDASPETRQAYYDSIRDMQKEYDRINLERKAKSIQVGSIIKVVRGRKVPKGTIAEVLRIESTTNYTMIFLSNGLVTYDKNVSIRYNGEFIEPLIYIEKTFYFQAI